MLVARESKLRPLVEISLSFKRPGWTIESQGARLLPSSDPTEYRIPAYLNGRINQISLVAKGPKGESESETLYLYAPDAQEFEVVSSWDRVLLTSGLSGLNYYQTGFGGFRSLSLLLSAQYATPPDRPSRWGLFGTADVTVLTMIESPNVGASPNLIQAKGDVMFRVTSLRPKLWNVFLLAGVNYTTMLSDGGPFGFANLVAPDLGVRARYLLSSKTAVVGDIHYVPVDHLTAFHDRGLDLSLSWSQILSNFHRAEIGLSFSTLNYQPDTVSTIQVNLLSARISYSI